MQTSSFTYVSDGVNAILKLIQKGKSKEIYNFGNDTKITIVDLARLIIKDTKSTFEIGFLLLLSFDPARRLADISKISPLGFANKTLLDKGIEIMVKKVCQTKH